MKLDLDHLERLANVCAGGEPPADDGSRLAYIYAMSLLQTVAEIRRLQGALAWIGASTPVHLGTSVVPSHAALEKFAMAARQRAEAALAGF